MFTTLLALKCHKAGGATSLVLFSNWYHYSQDPEVTAAFQDIQKNPANISKYENNPKVKKVMEKLASNLGKWGDNRLH